MPESEDLRKTRERLRQVADPLALLEGIFAHSPLALQIYDASGHSILTNQAFRKLFGSEPPPEYNVLEDDIARENGMLERIHRSFRGDTVHLPVTWYDPRALRTVHVPEGNRVAIETTFFPLWAGQGRIGHVAVVFHDVTAEHEARAQAEEERDLLRLVIAQGGDGVIVCDERGILRVFNPAAERQHGASRQEVGASLWAQTYGLLRMDGTPLPMEEIPLYRATCGQEVEEARWRVRRPDGSERVLSGTATPLRSAEGKLRGAVLITRDETDRLAQEMERASLLAREQAARAEAERANRAKDEFLAMLGHELRNPLAPVVTALSLLRARGLEWRRELQVIERQTSHLSRLVDDLLDVSRITRGKVELRKEPLEIAAAIQRAVEMATPLLEERRHALTVEAPARGLRVLGDETRLAQVIANLLMNSARYTDPGGKVSVSARREGGQVVVAVQDSGMGMSEDLVPRVFELFVQGGRTAERGEGGLGLGLALVKSLVQMHGGAVHAESPGPGRGSTFIVALPSIAEEAAMREAHARPAAGKREIRRILVVDDNVDAAEMLAEALRVEGHEVEVTYDGPEALARIAAFTPQVAVLDLGLPGMDGCALAVALRERLGRALRLVAVSGYGQERDRARTREAGFALHLVKPVELATLLEAVAAPGER